MGVVERLIMVEFLMFKCLPCSSVSVKNFVCHRMARNQKCAHCHLYLNVSILKWVFKVFRFFTKSQRRDSFFFETTCGGEISWVIKCLFHKCDYHFKFIEDAINVKNFNAYAFFLKKKKNIQDDESLSLSPA